MESLKKTFFGLVIVTIIFLIWTASLPEKLDMTKTKTYSSSLDEMYAQLSDFDGWESWFPWRDSSLDIQISGEAGAGQKLLWEHPEQGSGHMEMTEVFEDSLLRFKIVLIEDTNPVLSDLKFVRKNTGRTELQWHMYDSLTYEWPLGRLRAFVIQKMAGKNIESALDDLSSQLAH
ncbi:MAG: SRPBCC family protein [Bacteroidales bacterium]